MTKRIAGWQVLLCVTALVLGLLGAGCGPKADEGNATSAPPPAPNASAPAPVTNKPSSGLSPTATSINAPAAAPGK